MSINNPEMLQSQGEQLFHSFFLAGDQIARDPRLLENLSIHSRALIINNPVNRGENIFVKASLEFESRIAKDDNYRMTGVTFTVGLIDEAFAPGQYSDVELLDDEYGHQIKSIAEQNLVDEEGDHWTIERSLILERAEDDGQILHLGPGHWDALLGSRAKPGMHRIVSLQAELMRQRNRFEMSGRSESQSRADMEAAIKFMGFIGVGEVALQSRVPVEIPHHVGTEVINVPASLAIEQYFDDKGRLLEIEGGIGGVYTQEYTAQDQQEMMPINKIALAMITLEALQVSIKSLPTSEDYSTEMVNSPIVTRHVRGLLKKIGLLYPDLGALTIDR